MILTSHIDIEGTNLLECLDHYLTVFKDIGYKLLDAYHKDDLVVGHFNIYTVVNGISCCTAIYSVEVSRDGCVTIFPEVNTTCKVGNTAVLIYHPDDTVEDLRDDK